MKANFNWCDDFEKMMRDESIPHVAEVGVVRGSRIFGSGCIPGNWDVSHGEVEFFPTSPPTDNGFVEVERGILRPLTGVAIVRLRDCGSWFVLTKS